MKSISISSFAAILLIWTITACSPSNRVTGSNNYITKQIKVEKFNGLQLTGGPDVIYKQAQGKPSVEVYGQDNIVELLDIYVQNNSLTVKFKNNTSIQNRGKLEIRVSGPALNRIALSGSGDIKLVNGIQTHANFVIIIHQRVRRYDIEQDRCPKGRSRYQRFGRYFPFRNLQKCRIQYQRLRRHSSFRIGNRECNDLYQWFGRYKLLCHRKLERACLRQW